MGDRVSIRFVNGNGLAGFVSPDPDVDAPVIFSHWGGMGFVEAAVKYALDLIEERKGSFEPLDRLEPRTVTCDFLYNIDRYYPLYPLDSASHRISHDIYIGLNENDGDNGDNGHFNIDLGDVANLAIMVADIANRYAANDGWN